MTVKVHSGLCMKYSRWDICNTVDRDLWSINHQSPRVRVVYGHKSLSTVVYLLYSPL